MAYEVREGFRTFDLLGLQSPGVDQLHNGDEGRASGEIRETEQHHRDGWPFRRKPDSQASTAHRHGHDGRSSGHADAASPRRVSGASRFEQDDGAGVAPSLPINVPIPHATDGADRRGFEGVALYDERYHEPSPLESYLQHRRPSISFSPQVTLDTGHQYPLEQPIPKVQIRPHRLRGRSLLQDLARTSQRAPLERIESGIPSPSFDAASGEVLEQAPSPKSTPSVTTSKSNPITLPPLKTAADDLTLPSLTSSSTDEPASPPSQTTASPPTPPTTTPMSVILSPLTLYSPFPHPTSLDATSAWPAPKPSSRRQPSSTRASSYNIASPYTFDRPPSFRRRRTSTASQKRASTSSSLASPATAYLSRWSPRTPAPSDERATPASTFDDEGTEVGDYILGRQLGRGGFSRVLEAHTIEPQTQTSVTHAVKIVRRNVEGLSEAENEALQAQTEHEVEVWRCLSHRNILPLLGVRVSPWATYAFMRIVRGGTLFDVVREKRKKGVGMRRARRLTREIVEGVRYLHRDVRVAHRDLKLENCLLEREDREEPGAKNGFFDGDDDKAGHGDDGEEPSPKERILLCDFGLAQFLAGADDDSSDDNTRPSSPTPGPRATGLPTPPPESETLPTKPYSQASTTTTQKKTRAVAGSLQYASPELLLASDPDFASTSRGSAAAASSPRLDLAAVDVWALGCTVYALVTGSLPFMHALPGRVRELVLEGKWDRGVVRDREAEARGGAGAGAGRLHVDRGERRGFRWGSEKVGEDAGHGRRDEGDDGMVDDDGSGRNAVGGRGEGREEEAVEWRMGPVEELIDGCLKMDARERWDVGRVVGCRWLSGGQE